MKKLHLTRDQRYEIQTHLKMDVKPAEIARQIGKSRSVISREIRRNSDLKGRYRACYADEMACVRKERMSRPRKLTPQMEAYISEKIRSEQWSPEQIKGHADINGIPMVSHEAIYKLIRTDKTNGGDLYKNCRHRLKHRVRPIGGKVLTIKEKRSIDERPSVVDERSRIGDWEVDTIVGPANRGAMLTAVDRRSGFLFLRKLEQGKNSDGMAKVMIDTLLPYKADIQTITSDNGTEFARHKEISEKLGTDFYFAHPYSSWERGCNDNTNGLVRQYIPKKQNFDDISELEVKKIQMKINRRPRKKLGYLTPVQVFYRILPEGVALAS